MFPVNGSACVAVVESFDAIGANVGIQALRVEEIVAESPDLIWICAGFEREKRLCFQEETDGQDRKSRIDCIMHDMQRK